MAEKAKNFKFITPTGIAIYPKLHKPDTKWKAEGQYSVKLRLPGDAVGFVVGSKKLSLAELTTELEAIRDKFAEEKKAELAGSAKTKAKVKTFKVKETIFNAETNEDGDETGNIVINAKMTASGKSKKDGKPWTRSPHIFDAKGKKITPVPAIFGGSELKVAVEVGTYYTPKDNEVGVTFYLEAVQVIKLVKGGDRDAGSYGFGQEEGYIDDENSDVDSDADDSADNATDTSGAPAKAGDEF